MRATLKLPRRRWLRFSLGSMLLLVTLVCVWMAHVANRAHRQARAVAVVERAGGRIVYGTHDDAIARWVAPLLGREYAQSPVSILLAKSRVTDSEIEYLADLRFLSYVDLSRTQVTDDGLAPLAKLPHLHAVVLRKTAISDQGMTHLQSLEHLTDLDLAFTQVGDHGLAATRGMPLLRNLWLQGTQVSDRGLVGLKHFKKLTVINVARTNVTGRGMVHLRKLPNLRIVMLSRSQLDEHAIAEFKMLSSLAELWIEPAPDWPELHRQLQKELPGVRVAKLPALLGGSGGLTDWPP